jgi:hypothetical protein
MLLEVPHRGTLLLLLNLYGENINNYLKIYIIYILVKKANVN